VVNCYFWPLTFCFDLLFLTIFFYQFYPLTLIFDDQNNIFKK